MKIHLHQYTISCTDIWNYYCSSAIFNYHSACTSKIIVSPLFDIISHIPFLWAAHYCPRLSLISSTTIHMKSYFYNTAHPQLNFVTTTTSNPELHCSYWTNMNTQNNSKYHWFKPDIRSVSLVKIAYVITFPFIFICPLQNRAITTIQSNFPVSQEPHF